MKRLIPAVTLISIVIFSYFSSLMYINKSCKETEKLIKKCESAYSSGNNAYTTAKELDSLWDEKESGLSFFVNHNRIDDIELEISSLILYSKTENEIYFYEHVENLKMMLHQIKEDTKFTIHSVF